MKPPTPQELLTYLEEALATAKREKSTHPYAYAYGAMQQHLVGYLPIEQQLARIDQRLETIRHNLEKRK